MDGWQGAYPVILIGSQLLLYSFTLAVRASTDSNGLGLNCVIRQKNWNEPDFILVTWQLPDYLHDLQDVRSEISWFYNNETPNTGTCSVGTVTSCMCEYVDANFMCMQFHSDFVLNVTLVSERNQSVLYAAELPVNSEDCIDPPPQVNLINALPINGTCLNVTWTYTSQFPPTCQRSCSVTYRERVYNLTYTDKSGTKWELVPEKVKEPCGSHYVLCGLHPYRDYTVGVQSGCALENTNMTRLKGQWSHPTSTMVTTPQDVPSGAPQLTPSAFVYTRDDCLQAGTRDIMVFWKDIDPDLKNGLITAIQVNICEEVSHANTTRELQDFMLSSNETNIAIQSLECTHAYKVQIRASTVEGMSDVTSTIRIPIHTAGEVESVIPTINKNKTDLVHITWLVKDGVTFELDHVTVFWCFQDQLKCQDYVDWFTMPVTSNSTVLHIPADFTPLNYMFGVAIIYRSPESTNQMSSGIAWAKCIYIQSEVPLQPTGVSLGPDGPEGALTILWHNPPCYSRAPAPYVHHFLVRVCNTAANQQYSCSLGLIRTFEAGNQENTYFVHDLDPDDEFTVTIVAVGLNGQTSLPSIAVTGYPHGKGLDWPRSIIIPIAVVGSIMAIVGIVVLARKVYGRFRQCVKGVHIEDPNSMILQNGIDDHEV